LPLAILPFVFFAPL